MIETKMRQLLRAKLKATTLELLQIETGETCLGIPDTYFVSTAPKQFTGWMELKRVPTFDKDIIKIPWRPLQLPRAKKFHRAGERMWLCISADDTDEFVFIPGNHLFEKYESLNLQINMFSFMHCAHIDELSGDIIYWWLYDYIRKE